MARPDAFQKIMPTKMIGVLKNIATKCEKSADDFAARFKDIDNFYFRFNLVHGAEGVSLDEWGQMEKN